MPPKEGDNNEKGGGATTIDTSVFVGGAGVNDQGWFDSGDMGWMDEDGCVCQPFFSFLFV